MQRIYYQTCSLLGQKIIYRCPKLLHEFKTRGITFANVECFEVIDKLNLDFYQGNVFKYLWRLGEKHQSLEYIIEDLIKADYYLECAKIRGNAPPWLNELSKSVNSYIEEIRNEF